MTFPRSTNPHKTTKDLRKTRYRTQTSCSLTSLSKIIIILCMILSALSIIYPLPHDCQHRRADYDRWTPAADAHRTSSSLPSPRTQQLGAHVSFLLRYTLATHPRGHWACVCVCVCVFPLESFQVPRCHPADQTSRRKAQCFSAPSAADAASLLWAGAKDVEREDLR